MRLDEAPRGGSSSPVRTESAGPPAQPAPAPWRFRRASAFSAGRLAFKRLARGKALLLSVLLGMLVAVVLVCTVPLYNALVANIQLQREITADGPVGRNVEVHLQTQPIDAKLRAATDPRVRALGQRYLAAITTPAPSYYVVSDTLLALQAGGVAYDPAQLSTFQMAMEAFDFTTAQSHMTFTAGGLPRSGAGVTPPEILVTQQMATQLRLKVGDAITATHSGDHTVLLTMKIAGIWKPTDPNDPYWNGLSFVATGTSERGAIYPLLTTYDSFFASLPRFHDFSMSQRWVYFVRPERISTDNMRAVLDNLGSFRAHLNGDLLGANGVTDVAASGNLGQTIGDVLRQQDLLALPLYVVAAQIVGLALLFVTAMAGLLIEGQGQDIATLKSRGMSGTQILGVYLTQGTILGVFAALAGPFLAAALSLALVRRFLPTGAATVAGGSYLANIASPRGALVPALAGAALGVGAIALAALNAARLDVLAFRREQGRPTRQPLWRRYYLDLALALLCGIGYFELGQFGGTGTRLQVGEGANPLLLASPALLLLAGALIVLRLVPLAAALGERLASRGRGATSVLAFAQIERNPGQYSRMTLLLVLAVGLGLFALTFDASLTRNVSDRVAYSVGADLRTTQTSPEAGVLAGRVQAQYAQLPGVLAVTPVYRTQASTTLDQGDENLEMLVVDPVAFPAIAGPVSWRSDDTSQPFGTLMAQMHAHARGANAGTSGAPIWAIISQTNADQLHLHTGDRFTLLLGDAGDSGGTSFVVGAIAPSFPTLYPTFKPGGFLVVAQEDFYTVVHRDAPTTASTIGPNEYWLRTTSSPADHTALMNALATRHDALDLGSYSSFADALAAEQANPVGAGMRGLLLVGALTAALLAVLGSIVQAVAATRQRTTQFAILRTIGMRNRQIAALLLGEQVVIYLFGLLGGTALGLILASATLPFLQFSDTTVDPARLGVPPYQLVFTPNGMAVFYAALVVALVVALAIAARSAARIGLGKTLRLGED